jgi:uncharacterized membrane protein
VAVAAIVFTTTVFAANRGVTFTGIGFIEDPGAFPSSAAWSMNPQGTVVMASPTFFGNYCVHWTQENGWGALVGESVGECQVSANGTIMGTGIYPGSDPAYGWPGTWAGVADLWDPIPADSSYEPCGLPGITLFDMGGDGDFATGLTWGPHCAARAFRWDRATNTTTNLGSVNDSPGRGNAISNDGDTVVGWSSMLEGTWRATRWSGGTWSWVDGMGNIDPKACVVSGKSCTYDGDDPTYGCPEYVDDGTCQNYGTCVDEVCVGGTNPGGNCTGDWDCPGTCVGGPDDGASCTFDCLDTPVCLPNAQWDSVAFKGEARDVNDSGHIVGRNFGYDYPAWTSAWRRNPNGSFTEIPTLPTFPDTWEPTRMSEDGKTVVGMIGNPFFGSIPALWNEDIGTVDFQLFLIQQGLDELYFWYLTQLTDVSADGTVVSGIGFNPDGWQEGFVVDFKKVWICHTPQGNSSGARTLGTSIGDVGDHLAHGDFLGTCEWASAEARASAAELRDRLTQGYSADVTVRHGGARADANALFTPARPLSGNYLRPRVERNRSATRVEARSAERQPTEGRSRMR